MDNVYVPKNYRMNPETDDLIRGSKLRDGMRILVEESNNRTDPSSTLFIKEYRLREVADQWNRWCVVSDLEKGSADSIYFIGIYDDGTKRTFSTGDRMGWYVKKDSIPAPVEAPGGFKYQMEAEVFTLVKDRIVKLNTAQYHDEPIDFDAEAKTLTEGIMVFFKKEITAFVNDLKSEMVPLKDREPQVRYIKHSSYGREYEAQNEMPRVRSKCYFCTFKQCAETAKETLETTPDMASCPCCRNNHFKEAEK